MEMSLHSNKSRSSTNKRPFKNTHSYYEESKESRARDRPSYRDSYRAKKRSRSSRKYSKYSSKYKSGTSDSNKERKREKKYSEKHREDDFKIPSKYSITSSEYKRRKDQKYSYYKSSKYGTSYKSSTYNNYSQGKRDKSKDEDHYTFETGDLLQGRYKIIKHLGDGTFGRVYEVVSNRSGEHYACKIIRAVPRYIKSAKIEAKIL
jgi:dual-specificity kinase